MRKGFFSGTVLLGILMIMAAACFAQEQKKPPVVSAIEDCPPSDAIVLFDGTDLSEWEGRKGGQPTWTVARGAMTVNKGGIKTKREFGDIQLHLEFASPAPPVGEGQNRGNSGVYIHGNYEVQVLDSYSYISETYFDGQCGSIYKQHAPLVNASRAPGRWQTYDIIFRAAIFDTSGKKIKKAILTVLHNGVLIQDHVEVTPTGGAASNKELKKGPIHLQDHHHPVKFRNIWVREL
ncbi:MAG: DUF1080 domain-containing protein [Gemmatimonadota bacterium]|nr:DUF1080 domain-containing protein [Gemmatimonadota bacterium]